MTSVRVATYNLYLGADLTLVFAATGPDHLLSQAQLVQSQLRDTRFPERAEAIADILVRERVDVVGLQEVARWSRGPLAPDGTPGEPTVWCDFLVELLGALDRAGAPYDAHAVNPNFAGLSAVSGEEYVEVLGRNVTLVRRDSGLVVRDQASREFDASYEVVTGVAGLALTIHRGWGAVEAEVDGARFWLVNTHTEAHDAATRDAQRDELLAWLAARHLPAIVVGDFNATPGEVGMPPSYQDAWLVAGGSDVSGEGSTCGQSPDLTNPDSLLSERIDYVWVNGADVVDCRVVGNRAEDRTAETKLWPSDHACVLAEVDL